MYLIFSFFKLKTGTAFKKLKEVLKFYLSFNLKMLLNFCFNLVFSSLTKSL